MRHSALASNLVFCRPLPRPPRKSKIHGVGNPWGGKFLENPWTNTGILETRFSAKSQGLKTSWPCFTMFFEYFEFFYNVSALTFRCGSSRGTPGIYFSNRWRDHWHSSAQAQYSENRKHNIEKSNNRKWGLGRFVRPDVAKQRRDWSKNYFPPIPPTIIPFFWIQDHFY